MRPFPLWLCTCSAKKAPYSLHNCTRHQTLNFKVSHRSWGPSLGSKLQILRCLVVSSICVLTDSRRRAPPVFSSHLRRSTLTRASEWGHALFRQEGPCRQRRESDGTRFKAPAKGLGPINGMVKSRFSPPKLRVLCEWCLELILRT